MPEGEKRDRFGGVEKIDAEPKTIAARIMQNVEVPVMKDGEQIITDKGSKTRLRRAPKEREKESKELEEEKWTPTRRRSPL